ncbi:MAG: HpcH/HpaI aldolase/citrate lyase family protein [Oscillospiraceae bacterium]
MKENKLRNILRENKPSIATRIESTWPTIVEIVGSTGKYDYVEFVAEYAPYSLADFENLARTAELHNMASMIKVDFQNRAFVAQKAMASGFQAVLLVDHKTAEEVKESLYVLRPDTPADMGRFGYPNSRWIGYQPHRPQMEYSQMVKDTVIALMIEKKEAMDNIEEICAVPGVDIVQFGPSDYSMSCGWNSSEHGAELKAVERRMIEVAIKHGVQPRCEINTAEEAKYYIDLGVKHFCLGDELRNNSNYWSKVGGALKNVVDAAY